MKSNLIEFPRRRSWITEALKDMVADIQTAQSFTLYPDMKLLAEAGEPEPEDAA